MLVKNHRQQASQRRNLLERSSNHLQTIQGNMSEDEALAHALALSMQHDETNHNHGQSVSVDGSTGNGKDRCSLS